MSRGPRLFSLYARIWRTYFAWGPSLLLLAAAVFVPLGLVHAIPTHFEVESLDFDAGVELFALSLALAWGAPAALRIPVGILALAAYPLYIVRTLRAGGEVQEHSTLQPLIFERRSERRMQPSLPLSAIQLLVGLGAMVGGAHLFVEELLKLAEDLGVEAVVLALILAPLATELPEKVNSFFWVREGKDALALGNITGAMVFQSTIPFGIGLLFTGWHLSGNAALSIGLGLAGGLLAYAVLHRRGRFELAAVLSWFVLYLAFIVVVVATA